jgi:hypothetical protein
VESARAATAERALDPFYWRLVELLGGFVSFDHARSPASIEGAVA